MTAPGASYDELLAAAEPYLDGLPDAPGGEVPAAEPDAEPVEPDAEQHARHGHVVLSPYPQVRESINAYLSGLPPLPKGDHHGEED